MRCVACCPRPPQVGGGQQKYSDLAITLCMTLGIVYKQQLRQTQGVLRSVAELMGLEISVPDFSTLSRRSKGLVLPAKRRSGNRDPVHLLVDSTGLKIFGDGEWLKEKHNTKAKRKRWRKLHLGLDLATGERVRLSAPISQRMTSAISRLCPVCWTRSTALLPNLRPMVPMTARQPGICWQHALAKSWRSLSRLRRTPLSAAYRCGTHRFAIATLPG